MLALTRRVREAVVIDGGRIKVVVLELGEGKVRLGIEAPRSVQIDREEIHVAKVMQEKGLCPQKP